eukprot:gb/GECG01006464.1/.p1 GENE.gb/GECG01006464.1/~~gb/GECG01006464.1/.p1  ORF type:complete len:311 (+),score=49.59 gb/GECG01006464.1/:1-933(+)
MIGYVVITVKSILVSAFVMMLRANSVRSIASKAWRVHGTRTTSRSARNHSTRLYCSGIHGTFGCLNLQQRPITGLSFPLRHQARGISKTTSLLDDDTSTVAKHVTVEDTPNENSLKFVLTDHELEASGQHFSSIEETDDVAPIAKKIFEACGTDKITSVFFGADFVSVNKTPESTWEEMKETIEKTISDAIENDEPLVYAQDDTGEDDEDEDEVVAMIKEIIDTRIRPTVQEDGGDLFYVGFEDGRVKLRLAGSCVGCASSTETLYNGVEQMLMYYVPEVEGIEQVTDTPLDKVNEAEFEELEKKLEENG